MVDTTYHYMVQYSPEFFKRVVFFQMNIKRERLHIVIAGLIIGVIASLLAFFGNPANMGFCIACFLRDTAGGLGLHRAAAVQYIRPEIIGLVLFREPKLLMGFGAMRYQQLCREQGIECRVMPVPRNLSSSYGTCVRCEGRWLEPQGEAAGDVERIAAWDGRSYTPVYQRTEE